MGKEQASCHGLIMFSHTVHHPDLPEESVLETKKEYSEIRQEFKKGWSHLTYGHM
jgi:phage pi2 protein 07